MTFNLAIHHRRSIRLKGYDYAQAGAYYVTIVTQGRECLFGDVVNGEMQLNDAGRMVRGAWEALPDRFPTVELDEFQIMPNHIHGIIVIADAVGATLVVAQDVVARDRAGTSPAPTERGDGSDDRIRAGTSPAPTLGDIVGAFKSITTDDYIRGVHNLGWPPFNKHVWQRNYYEHIVRDERDLNRIRRYIVNNPLQWTLDTENPDAKR